MSCSLLVLAVLSTMCQASDKKTITIIINNSYNMVSHSSHTAGGDEEPPKERSRSPPREDAARGPLGSK